MNKLMIPMFQTAVYFYSPREKAEYEKAYNVVPDSVTGQANGNGVWVASDDNETVLHECIHLCDWLIYQRLAIDATDSITELRAYITEYLFSEYTKYLKSKS